MVLQRELAKLGVILDDNREIFPASELPAIAQKLGLKFYGPGEHYYLPEDTPVVVSIHEEGNNVDYVEFGTIGELAKENIVGLFTKGV